MHLFVIYAFFYFYLYARVCQVCFVSSLGLPDSVHSSHVFSGMLIEFMRLLFDPNLEGFVDRPLF